MEKGSGCNFNRIEYDILKWLQIKLVSTPKGNFSQCKGNSENKTSTKNMVGGELGVKSVPCRYNFDSDTFFYQATNLVFEI
jgi:hypothetical protein